tara:strand:- start:1904 stop:2140 length:237 start_codon:yes stop_codon:yes gene_type:complete
MKLREVTMITSSQLAKVRKIADKATKVVISGIDSIVGKDNLADEYHYFKVMKGVIDKRFEQILVKRHQRAYKTAYDKR